MRNSISKLMSLAVLLCLTGFAIGEEDAAKPEESVEKPLEMEEAKEREKLMTEVAEIARQHLIDIGADQSLSNLKIF